MEEEEGASARGTVTGLDKDRREQGGTSTYKCKTHTHTHIHKNRAKRRKEGQKDR